MRIIALIIGIIISTCIVKAQTNLVPNGDFEEKLGCPGTFNVVQNWLPCGSPDYYHICGITGNGFSIPLNVSGYQQPQSGVEYIGIGIYSKFASNVREYTKVKLKKKLTKGCKYLISLYYSNADAHLYFSNNFGIWLTSQEPDCQPNQFDLINIIPSLSNPNLTDTNSVNWMRYLDIYVASGGEEWLTIGNFLPDTILTLFNNIKGTREFSYLYIDNVQLYNLCEDSTLLQGICIKPQLPTGITVNADGKNDKLRLMNPTFFNSLKLNLYDRWGHLLYSTNDINFAWDGTFKGERVPIGVYQWQAVYTTIYDNKEQYATGNVTVLY